MRIEVLLALLSKKVEEKISDLPAEPSRGPRGQRGPRGSDGRDFDFAEHEEAISKLIRDASLKFEDLTAEQIEQLRGPQGRDGRDGLNGKDGKDFNFSEYEETIKNWARDFALKFEDLTAEQIGQLRGPQGRSGKDGIGFNFETHKESIADLISNAIQEIKEDLKLKIEDLNEEEINAIRGPRGRDGRNGKDFNFSEHEEFFLSLKPKFSDFTEEEVDKLRLHFSDLTDEEKSKLKLRFEDLTDEDRMSIRGPRGARGQRGSPGEVGETGAMGPRGPRGVPGPVGISGLPGRDGRDGEDGEDGEDAPYITEISVDQTKDEVEFVFDFSDGSTLRTNSIKLPRSNVFIGGGGCSASSGGGSGSGVPDGGTTGQVLAKKSDINGDVEWVDQTGGGPQGPPGKSAYVIAVENGFVGTEEEWLESLKGEDGEPGPAGADGAEGPQGPPGEDGAEGPKGDKGDTGDIGPTGPAGADGATGPKGDTGDAGPTGPKGDKGDKGDTGDTGPAGPKGDKGDKGDTGDTGPKGEDSISQPIGALIKLPLPTSAAPLGTKACDGDWYDFSTYPQLKALIGSRFGRYAPTLTNPVTSLNPVLPTEAAKKIVKLSNGVIFSLYSYGVYKSSDDGVTWVSDAPTGIDLYEDICVNTITNDVVVVGRTPATGSTVRRSARKLFTTGVWTSGNVSSTTGLTNTGVVFISHANIYASIGPNGTTVQQIFTSTDGVAWTARTTPTAVGAWDSIAYNPTLKMCVISSTSVMNRILSSPDGITWTNNTPSIGGGIKIFSVDTDSNTVAQGLQRQPRFVGFDYGPFSFSVWESLNGTTWTKINTISGMSYWNYINYVNGYFYVFRESDKVLLVLNASSDQNEINVIAAGPYNGGLQYQSSFMNTQGKMVTLTSNLGATSNVLIQDITETKGRLPYIANRTIAKRYHDPVTNMWYEIYSDGWVRQGGYEYSTTSLLPKTISLLVPFTNSKYTITASASEILDVAANSPWFSVVNKTSYSFGVYLNSNLPGRSWVAEGYGVTTDYNLPTNINTFIKVSDDTEPEPSPDPLPLSSQVTQVIWTLLETSPAGFIPASLSTIGKTVGTYQGNDYYALYAALWSLAATGLDNTRPFSISAAKGASALADWNSGKYIQINFKNGSPFIRVKGDAQGVGTFQENMLKSHTHNFVAGAFYARGTSSGNDNLRNSSTTWVTEATGGSETRPNNIAMYPHIRFLDGSNEDSPIPEPPTLPEMVLAEYYLTANQAVTASVTTLKCTGFVEDTHGIYNTTTGVIKVPEPMWIRIVLSSAVSTTLTPAIFKNGTRVKWLGDSNTSTYNNSTGRIYALPTDDIDIRFSANGTIGGNANRDVSRTWIEIERIR